MKMFKGVRAFGRLMFTNHDKLSGEERAVLVEDSVGVMITVLFCCSILCQSMGYGLALNTISIWVLILIITIAYERGVRINNG